jgi:hypothetical protein
MQKIYEIKESNILHSLSKKRQFKSKGVLC